MTSIDPELLRDLDRHLRGPQGDAPPTAPDASHTSTARADISGVVEAIHFAASSMSATAERIEQMEVQCKASEAAIQKLEEQNRHLSVLLSEAIQERDASAKTLEAEKDRSQRLESLAAHHVSRANVFEREFAASQADLAQIIDLVRTYFGALSGGDAAFGPKEDGGDGATDRPA